MANALIYGSSGSGKTVNSTLVRADKRGKNLLICSDNSSIVLNNFERKNLDIINVTNSTDFVKAYDEACESQKYDNIICDNLSDLFDMWILELEESGLNRDLRQNYQLVYQSLKRLSRKSTACDTNTIFTAWADQAEVTIPGGERIQRLQPKLPMKIIDNICGLMNVVGFVTTAMKGDQKVWFYVTEGNQSIMAKDQIQNRKSCMPEDVFGGKKNAGTDKPKA